MKRIVLGFSGDVAAAAAIPWLRERHDAAEVITLTLDFGQGGELAAIRERALALGAVRAHVIDAREELIRDYLLPALQAGAIMGGHALVYPLIAGRLVELARMEGAAAIAHASRAGSVAHGVIHAAARASGLEVITPADSWTHSEPELIARLREYGVHIPAPLAVRVDASLWGRRIQPLAEGGLDEELFTLTRAEEECPEYPALVDIQFASGVPVAANGVEMSMAELIESLETIAGAHGIGRFRAEGVVCEAPAALVLAIAHRELETRLLGNDLARLKQELAAIYSDALLNGGWFSDIRAAIDAFARIVQPRVSGTVGLQLRKGQVSVVSCETARSKDLRGPKAVA
jgi:argininosuccinate synthase